MVVVIASVVLVAVYLIEPASVFCSTFEGAFSRLFVLISSVDARV